MENIGKFLLVGLGICLGTATTAIAGQGETQMDPHFFPKPVPTQVSCNGGFMDINGEAIAAFPGEFEGTVELLVVLDAEAALDGGCVPRDNGQGETQMDPH